ncbi:hypothetical protein [Streptomyces sp. NBC_01446]|uniref:hypothetical protein n=1 Tax=Streptomyces sp. NBC_01446 TaxID=2903870 RepID=UPI00224C9C72|nr:hypothetical protein [Streptomyces sp. NBC_01446]MCX4647050.1 hypothetical protein [Streptomyces sp. NBC_01446]
MIANGGNTHKPLPAFGPTAPLAAAGAVRTYTLTLNAGLESTGVYADALSIGGMIERSATYEATSAYGDTGAALPTFDPEDLAECAWKLFTERDRAEGVFTASTS